jgi:N-methylhydantoinase A/oxoprolinase/acetone carboxylase beta subunit
VRALRIGVDLGGTFTDCVMSTDDGAVVAGKVPTTLPVHRERAVRMRFEMQVYDVEVPVGAKLDAESLELAFISVYEARFGAGSVVDGSTAVVTGWMVRAWTDEIAATLWPARTVSALLPTPDRDVFWSELGGRVSTPVFRVSGGERTRVDEIFTEPVLLELPHTVAVVRPGQTATFDPFGNAIIDTPGPAHARAAS